MFYIFSSTGAIAQLHGISCLYYASPTPSGTIQEPLHDAWVSLTSEITVQPLAAFVPALLFPEVVEADHYFIPKPIWMGLPPFWDFGTNQKVHGQENAVLAGRVLDRSCLPLTHPIISTS